MSAVREDQDINLVVNLEQWNDQVFYDRLGTNEEFTTILDMKIPAITIPIKPGRNLAIIVEVAAMNNRHKRMGYNAAQEFAKQLDAHFEQMMLSSQLDAADDYDEYDEPQRRGGGISPEITQPIRLARPGPGRCPGGQLFLSSCGKRSPSPPSRRPRSRQPAVNVNYGISNPWDSLMPYYSVSGSNYARIIYDKLYDRLGLCSGRRDLPAPGCGALGECR